MEFKEAKGQYSGDKIGQYFSAISNEANLKNQQYGWFILGVSEQKDKYPVGTNFKKGHGQKLTKEAIALLRKHHLVEGRINSLYLSADVSKTIDADADYIKNKAFNDQYYKDMIVEYLKQYGRARKSDLRKLLIDKLPDSLSDRQKESKIGNLLTSLRTQGVIKTDLDDRLYWILA